MMYNPEKPQNKMSEEFPKDKNPEIKLAKLGLKARVKRELRELYTKLNRGENNRGKKEKQPKKPRRPEKIKRIIYRDIKPPNLGYKKIVREPDFSNVKLAERDTDIGRAERAMRFKNIADAVSKRYGIPSYFLLAMIMQESYGDPTQPNLLRDAGLGLIHMQPLMASKYGLELITDSQRLRDFKQGKKIEETIDLENADLKDLVKYDDRFHPIKNVDAAARMLCDLYNIEGWWGALKRYAGRRSYPGRIVRYAQLLRSPGFQQKMRKDFEQRNPKLKFQTYLNGFYEMNRNYGLDDYKKLPVINNPMIRPRKKRR